jgi:hypothetical protein
VLDHHEQAALQKWIRMALPRFSDMQYANNKHVRTSAHTALCLLCMHALCRRQCFLCISLALLCWLYLRIITFKIHAQANTCAPYLMGSHHSGTNTTPSFLPKQSPTRGAAHLNDKAAGSYQ